MLQYTKEDLIYLEPIMKNHINKYIMLIVVILLISLIVYKSNIIESSSVINKTKTSQTVAKAQPLQYSGSTILNKFNKKNVDNYQTAAGTYDIATMASTVTNQMLKAFSNTTEKTLPLVANWNAGIPQYSDGLDSMYMINRLVNGEHTLPSWKLAPYYNDTIGLDYYEASIKKAAELGLPLVFILPSPESALTKDAVYFSMDKTQNPNVITTGGIVLPKLSPFAPDALWNEVGEQWSSTSLIAQLQEWYPNPPLVLFVDEDTASKLSWSELSSSSRYAKNYPTDGDDNFKRNLVNAAWMEKYRQLHKGIKNGFTQDGWKNNIKFVSRNQLASNMGRTSTWLNSATTTKQYANIWPHTTNALTIDLNLDNTTTYSDINNLPFMLDEAKQANPNFTYELSINANSTIDNPQLYRGLTQFALWFLRPSIIRQTPNQTTKDEINPLFQQVVDSVDLVNDNEILADFWQNGKLLKTGESTLESNVPTQYQTIPRWFLLKTDSNQKVWSFAIEKGETPNREWLIYAESPEDNVTDVTVSIPNFGDMVIDTTQEGSFYTVNETTPTKTTAIMAIQKTNSTSILDTNSTYVSPYLEQINIPEYNSSDPSHVLITPTNGNWSKEVLNDPNKKHFYITPGVYHDLIRLETSGTADERRTISLYNGNDIHPAALDFSEIADIRLWLKNCKYWTLDRLANIDDNAISFRIYKEASHNILNKLYIKNFYSGVIIKNKCNFNTVQNSFLDGMSLAGILHDNVGLSISGHTEPTRIEGTKFINNDIRNTNDGIQLVRAENKVDLQFPGTILDSNHIWMDGNIYTNGDYNVSGFNFNGKYMIGENAIDIKVGSDIPKKPLIISNNIMWGYQQSDSTIGGTASVGSGTAFVAHFGVDNTKFINNIIFNSQKAFTIGGRVPAIDFSARNWTIENNIFYNINKINPLDDKTYAMYINNSNNMKVIGNTYKDIYLNSKGKGYLILYINTINSTFSKESIINAKGTIDIDITQNQMSDNKFYNSENSILNINQKAKDKVINYKRFTKAPEQILLKSVLLPKN